MSAHRHFLNYVPYDPRGGAKTTVTLIAYMDGGNPMLNEYTRYAKIGNGHHGQVYLCFKINPKLPFTDPKRLMPVAMKSVRRDNPRAAKYQSLRDNRLAAARKPPLADRLNTAEAKIRKEIAIMKKLRHPNVVRLYEVIDDRMKDKIYMVMEYLGGGEVKWRNDRDQPILTLAQTRRIMRDAILGLEYLHYQGIIHRDIKPANLLWTDDRRHVKIGDFGVSHFSYAQRLAAAGRQEYQDETLDDILLDESDLTKRAGTPSFLAPELIFEHCSNPAAIMASFMSHQSLPAQTNPMQLPITPRPPITKAIDVWALGVTLYCLLFGKTPFVPMAGFPNTEYALYNSICNADWDVDETMGAEKLPTGGRHPKLGNEAAEVIALLERFLEKDQGKRISLDGVKQHPWTLKDMPEPQKWLKLTSPNRPRIDVTTDEASSAMTNVFFRWGHWSASLAPLGRGVSAFLRPLRPRRQALPPRPSPAVGPTKSDSHATLLLPSAKSPAATGIQDVHVYAHQEKRRVTPLQIQEPRPSKGKAPASGGRSPSSGTPTSAALQAVRRHGSEMGLLQRREGSISQLPSPTGSDRPKGIRFKDVFSIISWKPTKYPSVTTSTAPLLGETSVSGRSDDFGGNAYMRKGDDQNIRVPTRTVSTLSQGFLQQHDDSSLSPNPTPTAFKRASSWGQGDAMAETADVMSVMSIAPDLNERELLVGAGGVETSVPYPVEERLGTEPNVYRRWIDLEHGEGSSTGVRAALPWKEHGPPAWDTTSTLSYAESFGKEETKAVSNNQGDTLSFMLGRDDSESEGREDRGQAGSKGYGQRPLVEGLDVDHDGYDYDEGDEDEDEEDEGDEDDDNDEDDDDDDEGGRPIMIRPKGKDRASPA